MRLKKKKISLFPTEFKKVDKSFGSLPNVNFANMFEWGLKIDKILLFPLELKKNDKSFGSLSDATDATFANIFEG